MADRPTGLSPVRDRRPAGPAGAPPPSRRRPTVIVSSVASDSHTWNLVYLQLLIEELGYEVVNLGPCVPDELLVAECREHRPALVVISSVNGHGHQDGLRVIGKLRARPELARTPVVIGGKLGVSGSADLERGHDLVAAGFTAVFQDGADEMGSFHRLLASLPGTPAPPRDALS
ncbi:cobalamin B12-binding domain-containing protein [Allonocardiopsis opalescens]|uniref:Methylaspartate mutase sigma subunit n=1 Tax=Allonocardiopsis opalescens TaxID=1144618 RepID=A0A2T0QD10_9ACTN|nr:cobalamin-dependent protein [Allonocardiopsis opalescens]PRY01750.1 methylaspartate mutase sigma subunit [Allonocardiopsis opalescens]